MKKAVVGGGKEVKTFGKNAIGIRDPLRLGECRHGFCISMRDSVGERGGYAS
jgi:hypothetical protein